MNDKPTSQTDERLRSLLDQWRVEVPLPPRFQEQVWNRIERNVPVESISLGAILLSWFRSSVARPALAVAYALVMLVAGLTAGFAHGHHQNAQLERTMETEYIQSVDPYQK